MLRRGGAAACGALLAIVLASSSASAQRIVVGDVAGAGDESGAVTLLLRSMLRSGQRPAVSVAELMLAFQRNPGARVAGFRIDRAHAGALMKDLGADRVLVGELGDGERPALSLSIVAPADQPVATTTVQSLRGDVARLALEAANRVAKAGGVTVTPVDASLGELRPFVRAARALGAGDAKGAAEALRVASRGVAARVSAAKDIADAVWRDAELPTDLRIVAALAAGESNEAINLGRADTSKNPDVRAQQLRAELAASDVNGANKTLAAIKGAKGDAALLARAEYDLQKKKPADAARELAPLLARDPPSSPALAMIASLPPGALDAKTEGLAVSAARGVAGSQPGVASMVGLRAARGGNKSADAVSLVKPDEMRPMELADADKLFGDTSSPQQKAVVASIEQQRSAKVVEVAPKNDAAAGDDANKKRKAAPVALYVSDDVRAIAQRLQPLLARFPQLEAGNGETVVVYPIKGSSMPWQPYWVRRAPLGPALEYALSSHNVGVVLHHDAQDAHPRAGDVARLADLGGDESAPLLLLYRCTAEGGDANVELELYSVADDQLLAADETIDGQATRLVRLNPILIPAGALVALALVIFLGLHFLRVGEVIVDVKRDPGAEKEMLAIVISKRPKPPAIEDLEHFHRATPTRGGRTYQLNASARTTFPRVPAGKRWVHVYGTIQKGGEIRAIAAGLSRQIVVKHGGTHSVELELDPNTTEYRVHVVDAGPVAGATLVIDDNRATTVTTDREGNAIIHLSHGQHVLHIAANGEKFEKRIDVLARKVQLLDIALPKERLARERVGGIALSQDVHAPRHAAPRELPSAPVGAAAEPPPQRPVEAPLPVHAAAAEPDDDGVSLPEGFHVPSFGVAAVAGGNDARAATSGLGRYRKGAELGRGRAGVVFKGRDTVGDRDVAIKILFAGKKQDAQTVERYLREGRPLVGLDHPNLVTVFDLGVEAGEPFAVMELVSGQTLESLMRARGPLPMDELLVIADQICVGLAFAHDKRIVHRNLHPANIFVGSDGKVKIGDFAVVPPPADRATNHWSPEQRRGEAADARSDLYSVGCTLFQLACGQAPPASAASVKVAAINADVHPDFDKLLTRCLEPDRTARIASAEELRKLLRPLKAIYC